MSGPPKAAPLNAAQPKAAPLDGTDWAILDELQRDARISFADLARRVHLGASATTERVRRLEALGVIQGYRAVIDLEAVGVPVLALVRLRYFGHQHDPFRDYLATASHVLECLRVTGEDCYALKIGASSSGELESHVDALARFGDTTTSLVYSQPLPLRGPSRPGS